MKRLSQKHRIVAWMKSHRGERLSPRRALFMNMGTKLATRIGEAICDGERIEKAWKSRGKGLDKVVYRVYWMEK